MYCAIFFLCPNFFIQKDPVPTDEEIQNAIDDYDQDKDGKLNFSGTELYHTLDKSQLMCTIMSLPSPARAILHFDVETMTKFLSCQRIFFFCFWQTLRHLFLKVMVSIMTITTF